MLSRLAKISLIVVLLALLVACGLAGGSTSKPTIVILSPAGENQFHEGDDVTVQSVATDQTGVGGVDLTVDGVTARTDKPETQGGGLFTLTQKWKAVAGTHTLGVRAYNASGGASELATVKITVVPGVAQAVAPTVAAVPSSSPTTLAPLPGSPPTATVAALTLPAAATVTPTVTSTATVSSTTAVTSTVTAAATVSSTAEVTAPLPVVLPPCPPASHLPSGMLFCDDFASKEVSESAGWVFGSDAQSEFNWSPNSATLTVKAKDWSQSNWPNGNYVNFGAEIEAQAVTDGYVEYGLAFRASANGDNLYTLTVATDGGYVFDKLIAGNWSDSPPVKWTASSSVKPGKSKNLIGVIAQGNTFALYINHVLVNTITDDSIPGAGSVGAFVYNGKDSPTASVAFTLLDVLTPEQAKADWSGTAPSTSASAESTTAPPPPTAPPGLYVTSLRTDPPTLGPSMDAGFYVTFLNTTNAEQKYRWNVFVFREDNPKNSFGEASAQLTTIPVGTVEQNALGSWRLGVGTCGSYFARVAWLDEGKNRTYFTKPDGNVYELWFTVCQ